MSTGYVQGPDEAYSITNHRSCLLLVVMPSEMAWTLLAECGTLGLTSFSRNREGKCPVMDWSIQEANSAL